MLATPAAASARNGTSSTRSSRSRSCSMRGRSRWLSTLVSPWPGKCLAQAATPSRCSPSAKATAWRATSSGSREKLRSPITGFAGLVSTSATGREVEIHAQVGELAAERAGQLVRVRRRAALAEPSHRRPLGPGRAQALHAAALLVDRHRERRVRRRALVQLGDQRAQSARASRRCARRARRPPRARRRSARRDPPAARSRRIRRTGAAPAATAKPPRTP